MSVKRASIDLANMLVDMYGDRFIQGVRWWNFLLVRRCTNVGEGRAVGTGWQATRYVRYI